MQAKKFALGRIFIGRIYKDEDILTSLTQFVTEKLVHMAGINLIGSVSKATILYFNQKKQKYEKILVNKNMEIVSCMGNISLKSGKPILHLHIVLSDNKGQTIAGHLMENSIAYAIEFEIREYIGDTLSRIPDDDTGLNLWKM